MNAKKTLSMTLAAAMAAGLLAGCGGSSSTAASSTSTSTESKAESTAASTEATTDAAGKVYYLNFKPEQDEAWQNLAKKYTEETGVPVTVVTAASGQYETTLMSEMAKSDAPTLFQVNGPVGLANWKDYCYDLSGTKIAGDLTSDTYALKDGDQMLLTWEDFDHENRLHNLQNTLERLLQLHAIPIINENDPVACEEYSLGDNDTLAALVAKCIHADLVVLMSDIDGLYTADPHTHPDAKLIPVVEEITPEIEMLAGGAGSALGTGGMLTKVTAAKRATEAGVDMIITNGAHAEVLYDIVEGKPVGTRFVGRKA